MRQLAPGSLFLRRVAMLFSLIFLPTLTATAQQCSDDVLSVPPAGNLKYIAEIEPSTTWQPSLGEVRFTITGTGFKPDNVVA